MNTNTLKISQDRIRQLFNYQDGNLVRAIPTGGRGKVGAVAGYLRPNGYWCIKIDNVDLTLHRVIYTWHHGDPGLAFIDHIDGDPNNNNIENLRKCTNAQNMRNQKPRKGCSSQYKGVTWRKKEGKWYASLRAENANKYLGVFDDEEEAARAYDKAAKRFFGDFCRLNFP